ncbi:MAG: efflux RND transporter permease subunit, partial [Gemmataceae bacterium]
MRLADLSIRNPVFAVMVGAAMIVFGWMGYREMGISQFPEIDFPVVSIVITREAASPEIMDGDVTDVVEDAVASVEGVDYTMSESLEGRSITTVYFQLGRDIDVAMQDVQNAVSAARRKLPIDIDPPVISKINPANLPVVWLTLSGAFPVGKLGDLAEKELKPLLSSLPGVGGVQFAGLQERNVRVHVDRDKLRQFNLSAEDVRLAIQRQHAELPAGYIKSQQVEFNLRVMGEAATLAELGRLIVFQKSGQTVRLEDVAVVADSTVDKRGLARYNRLPAVAIGIRKAIGGNLVSVCDAVRAEMPRLARLLPPGVDMAIPVDSSRFVRENIDELKLTLILGVVLTAIVCYLFLGSLETTVNICLSIPTSLLGTFFFLNYGARWIGMEPFTLNLMTLLGLSLSVGVVVDDAILVLENIHRHREMGKDAKKSARDGSREIGFAALAATLSILAIFMPVAFLSGTIGRFFFQFGVTVGVAVMLSLVSALTITPMLCSLARAPGHAKGWRVPCAMALFLASVLLAARFIFASIDWLTQWLWPLATLATTTGLPTPSLFITWPLETAGQCAVLISL